MTPDLHYDRAIEAAHKLALQVKSLQEERERWRVDNEKLSADNDRLRALVRSMGGTP